MASFRQKGSKLSVSVGKCPSFYGILPNSSNPVICEYSTPS